MITFILATTGRPSLQQTLDSIECWPGDEILVVGNVHESTVCAWTCPDVVTQVVRYLPCPPGNDWGSSERNYAMPFATGRYLSFMDDDDTYAPGHRAVMQDAITKTPNRPVIFRLQYPNGTYLWREQSVIFGNVGTPMFLIPNVPERLGQWGSFVGGDLAFIEGVGWLRSEFVWRQDVIALIGDNVPSHAKDLQVSA